MYPVRAHGAYDRNDQALRKALCEAIVVRVAEKTLVSLKSASASVEIQQHCLKRHRAEQKIHPVYKLWCVSGSPQRKLGTASARQCIRAVTGPSRHPLSK